MTPRPPGGGARSMNAITRKTRQAIADLLTSEFNWWGELSEVEFLAELYPLHDMPSTDYRPQFNTAYLDIEQHRVRNSDGSDRWVFSDHRFKLFDCPDADFVAFLDLTVSEAVRSPRSAALLALELSTLLAGDGYEVVEHRDGRYACRERGFHAPVPAPLTAPPLKLGDRSGLDEHLKNIEADLGRGSFAGVISACKDLIETVLKQILAERGVVQPSTIPDLFSAVRTELDLDAILIPDDPKASKAEARGMEMQTRMVAEIRNTVGRGHGHIKAVPLKYRNAQHVLYTTVAVVTNLFAVWDEIP